MEDNRTSWTIGKVGFSIGSQNLRLHARIGSNITFIGGNNNQGYFKSIEAAKAFVESKREQFENCKSMKKLIYI